MHHGPVGEAKAETDGSYYGSDCDRRILRRGYERAGPPDGVTGRERGGQREFRNAGGSGESPRVFGSGEWAKWRLRGE